MIISLAGYMGSGKTRIARLLSEKTGYDLIDLDDEIMQHEGLAVSEIFRQKGELHFRKVEKKILSEILSEGGEKILSLGGGTPAYYDNMQQINQTSRSIYLQASIPTLVNRLKRQKTKRPIIAHLADEELPEFVAKHLFERMPYYSQSENTVQTDGKSPEEIVAEIIHLLGI